MSEKHLFEAHGNRKGRGQRPCVFKIGCLGRDRVLIRTVDEDGIAPIVAHFDTVTARAIAKAILESASLVEGN